MRARGTQTARVVHLGHKRTPGELASHPQPLNPIRWLKAKYGEYLQDLQVRKAVSINYLFYSSGLIEFYDGYKIALSRISVTFSVSNFGYTICKGLLIKSKDFETSSN